MSTEHDDQSYASSNLGQPSTAEPAAARRHAVAGSDVAAAAAEADPEPRDREAELDRLRAQFAAAQPVDGTAAEAYLIERCRLQGPWPEAVLRYAPAYRSDPDAASRPCLLAAVTDATGAVVALHSVDLDPSSGGKSTRTDPTEGSRGMPSDGTVFVGDPSDSPSVLVVAKGLEAALTRRVLGACDAHVCLDGVRWVDPLPRHERVEIIADTDARPAARRLARRYAGAGRAAFVVTVPDALGADADLNDLLRDGGLAAVRDAVEDAERTKAQTTNQGAADYDLQVGSDIEIARVTIDLLENLHGPLVVADGRIWYFGRMHWMALEDNELARSVHEADGALYPDAGGGVAIVRLNRNRVRSIIDAMLKYNLQPDFFRAAPTGINCESGFIRLGEDGRVELLPHGRRWRQRHVVGGRFPCDAADEVRKASKLAKVMRETFAGDADAEEKRALVAELFGCAALGWGTRLRNPKAVVVASEEGGTAKSTFLHLLRAMPNAEAVASVPPNNFGDEKYAYRLIGKTLNAADELSDRAIRSDIFKRMITGEPVPARDVYKSATDFRPTALHVFSTNVLPTFSGGIDGGLVRRLLPVAFNRVVPEDERDPDIASRIVEQEADLLLEMAVEGARRLVARRDFTVPASSRDLHARWTLQADPVRAWVTERLEVTEDEHVVAVAELYADFIIWCQGQRFRPEFLPSAVAFGKRLRTACPRLGYHRSDGSLCRNARLRPTGRDEVVAVQARAQRGRRV